MIEKWFSTMRLLLTLDQFKQLPQNRAYKYEYIDGEAWLTPRPKSYHALLGLDVFDPPIAVQNEEPTIIRRLADEDWERLPSLFAAAFHRVQPFAGLDDALRLQAAEECLGQTREGADGPPIGEASFVAMRNTERDLIGAALTTLGPGGDPSEFDSWRWHAPPPRDALTQRIGRPHLTWIFVAPLHSGLGVGTTLLSAIAQALTRLGYSELASTFLLGNEASTLWHWRTGFRLLPHPGSIRRIRQQMAP